MTAFAARILSKYDDSERPNWMGRLLVCLKPCDTYSFNQLLKEHRDRPGKSLYHRSRLQRESLILKKSDPWESAESETLTGSFARGQRQIRYRFETSVREKRLAHYADAMLGRCHVCKGKEHQIYDERIGESKDTKDQERFAEVERIEAMSPQERFAYFQSELGKCIRCNACRNVCPACSCRKCVFDSNKFDSSQKANVDSFEEKMFHIIRAFHVAGRCTDCGECSRVCPQGIPLHLFNRKFIKDIDELYGNVSGRRGRCGAQPADELHL